VRQSNTRQREIQAGWTNSAADTPHRYAMRMSTDSTSAAQKMICPFVFQPPAGLCKPPHDRRTDRFADVDRLLK